MSSSSTPHKYDQDGLPILSGLESASLTWVILRMPFLLLWTALASKLKKTSRPLNRLLFETSSRHILGNTTIEQLQKISGTSIKAYRAWAKQANKEPVIETLDDGTRVFWVGAKDADYVLIYCHGGGFVGPLCDFQCKFIEGLCAEFGKQSNGPILSCAILDYSVLPTAYPAQMTQLHSFLSALLPRVPPNRVFLAGESAGANILTQLFSATLHPLDSLPAPLDLSVPLAGTLLISPWCALNPTGKSMQENATKDLLPPVALNAWGTAYRRGVPAAEQAYADVDAAPPGWYTPALAGLTARVLVTVGDAETLRDDIARLTDVLRTVHPAVAVDVQPGGVHADMVFDVAAKSKELSPVTVRVATWLVESAGIVPT
ncbi:hypothetical protein PHLGIDRAFT_111212 [Phlebiopsis gigantea 11061_1 CR5-6]|uniref:Alpha/beta hydrolase fold-3 domain-containing protein n=1 Tax=Phlebiopsis gigantea (strain 11061_1 CR5-6) TaxID=745531 RepID=A0A0C3PD35_PHLG1|nr:hypothetical protein PHLGIDRAFT_111212 [Phlebiopsis gigantea 11061_1 CR5-6]